VTIGDPGLKPSFRLYGAGSTGVPDEFFGISARRKRTRLPVSVEESATVK
jgi:hypothetical protein